MNKKEHTSSKHNSTSKKSNKNIKKVNTNKELERIATNYFNDKNYEKAHELYTKLLERKPSSIMTILQLSGCKRNMGDIYGAISLCREAIQIDPKYSTTYLVLGHLHMLKNEYTKALKVLKKGKNLGDEDCIKAYNLLKNEITQMDNNNDDDRENVTTVNNQNGKYDAMELYYLAERCAQSLIEMETLNKFIVNSEKSKIEALLFCLELVRKVFSPEIDNYDNEINDTHILIIYIKCHQKGYSISLSEVKNHCKMHRNEIKKILSDEHYLGATSAYHIFRAPLDSEKDLNYILSDSHSLDEKEIFKICIGLRVVLGISYH